MLPQSAAAYIPADMTVLPETEKKSVPKKRVRISLSEFRQRYSGRKDGHKYEFIQGHIEKTPSNMNIHQAHIVKNLTRRFMKTSAFSAGAELMPELDQMTAVEKLRRPDLTYLSKTQLRTKDEHISDFVIEILSPNDKVAKLNEKIEEYFAAGVKVLWLLHPNTEKVEVYTSLFDIKVCKGSMLCSAEPVLPDMTMSAAEIFAKPE